MSAISAVAGVAGSLAARVAGSERLLILTYHRVLSEHDPLIPHEPWRSVFTQQMKLLRRHFNPLPLEEAFERMGKGSLPSRAVCVTFDDGYTDNYLNALPILEETGVPATCFVATDYLDGGCMFNDVVIEAVRRVKTPTIDVSWLGLGKLPCDSNERRRDTTGRILDAIKYEEPAVRRQHAERLARESGGGAPADLMMSAEQASEMAARGVAFGAHTRTHPILARISQEESRNEIRGSRERLEKLLGRPVRMFAYPNGRSGRDFLDRDVEEVRAAGFTCAVTTDWGCAKPNTDPLRLPRINVSGERGDLLGLRLGKYFFE